MRTLLDLAAICDEWAEERHRNANSIVLGLIEADPEIRAEQVANMNNLRKEARVLRGYAQVLRIRYSHQTQVESVQFRP